MTTLVPSGQMHTDVEVMRQVAAQFNTQAESLDSNMRILLREADNVRGVWRGAAGTAFDTTSGEVAKAWEHLNAVLAEISRTINVQGTGYDTKDTDNATRVTNVPVTNITSGLSW